MFKVGYNEFVEFMVDYYKGCFPNQRLGQAFVNFFGNINNTGWTDNCLFYQEDHHKAMNEIVTNYVEVDE